MNTLSERLSNLVAPILQSEKIELVDLQIKGREGSRIVKIFIDTESGISLAQCTDISRKISEQLDINDVIAGKYRLEVSSPGVARPLQSPRDFARNLNREVEVIIQHDCDEERVRGKIADIHEQAICIECKDEVKKIPLSKIKHGKLCLPW
ncbi:MAG: ribosome maturation factor RimP [bacterium]